MKNRVILLEFNELSPALIRHFIEQGHLPNFKKFHDESLVYITDAGEDVPNLEPWIQWVTVHTGLPYAEHGLFHLDEGHKLDVPRLWDIVSEAGSPVWICGSMNVNYREPLNGYLMPDPWTTNVAPSPESLLPFFVFVQRNILEHTSDTVSLSRSDYLKFVRFMVRNGMSSGTVMAILRQLFTEKTTGKYRWKRALLLDKLLSDLFGTVWKRMKPGFATFFLNSTAHFQHYHWREMQPEIFGSKPSDEQVEEYGDAILQGYQAMDAILEKMMKMAGDDTTLVLASALSQQPMLDFEEDGGKRTYRPRKFEEFLAFAGLPNDAVATPVMAEQFYVRFADERQAAEAESRLADLTIDGKVLLEMRREGKDIFAGCGIYTPISEDAMIRNGEGREVRFYDLFYVIREIRSGRHHPEGILWFRTPERTHVVHAQPVPLETAAPTILDVMGLERPDFMKAEPLSLDGVPA